MFTEQKALGSFFRFYFSVSTYFSPSKPLFTEDKFAETQHNYSFFSSQLPGPVLQFLYIKISFVQFLLINHLNIFLLI